eukprot:TRINITY_DN13145_c0_g1_i3.p2 TRINITY_DN13145_c0_g1~~TRINITY_DN13145_c0_g1_i3.p2  ORF type:complete len:187 (-),score=24.36 TRINITY_DN13145_c0_g1_i3:302-862(-)
MCIRDRYMGFNKQKFKVLKEWMMSKARDSLVEEYEARTQNIRNYSVLYEIVTLLGVFALMSEAIITIYEKKSLIFSYFACPAAVLVHNYGNLRRSRVALLLCILLFVADYAYTSHIHILLLAGMISNGFWSPINILFTISFAIVAAWTTGNTVYFLLASFKSIRMLNQIKEKQTEKARNDQCLLSL